MSHQWVNVHFPETPRCLVLNLPALRLPHIISRMGSSEVVDVNLFCLVAMDFYRHQIDEELDRRAFQSVFETVASPGSPYYQLLGCLQSIHQEKFLWGRPTETDKKAREECLGGHRSMGSEVDMVRNLDLHVHLLLDLWGGEEQNVLLQKSSIACSHFPTEHQWELLKTP